METSAAPRKSRQRGEYQLPTLPSLLTRPLGLEGWSAVEPVLLAALATEEPLLLIGPHGSAKSFLLERLAIALKHEYRFYNASLINYDDLVGIPMPTPDRTRLEFISTPAAIWDAEVVFFDEINRTKPELQNKLFPIVHERRVQGLKLDKLRYRWSAMNPAPSADESEETDGAYFGAEPLDTALADRFSFILEVPGWEQLTDEERRAILRDQYTGEHSFLVQPADLVSAARRCYLELQQAPPQVLEDYHLAVTSMLAEKGVKFSTRRATMIHRNILAVHAARIALYGFAFPAIPAQAIDWRSSALLAIWNSLPQTAQGQKPDMMHLMAAHKHAWELARLDADNPWRTLLMINDPLERATEAFKLKAAIDEQSFSHMLIEAISADTNTSMQTATALAFYLACREERGLPATTLEILSNLLLPVLQSRTSSYSGDAELTSRVKQAERICEKAGKDDELGRYTRNLLQGLLPDGFIDVTPRDVVQRFTKLHRNLTN